MCPHSLREEAVAVETGMKSKIAMRCMRDKRSARKGRISNVSDRDGQNNQEGLTRRSKKETTRKQEKSEKICLSLLPEGCYHWHPRD